MKTFQFAGCSRVNGELKFRTAMSQARAQQLAKLGDTDVNMLIEDIWIAEGEDDDSTLEFIAGVLGDETAEEIVNTVQF